MIPLDTIRSGMAKHLRSCNYQRKILVHSKFKALQRPRFQELYKASDEDLQYIDARRVTADCSPGYLCCVSLQEAAIG